MRMNLWDVQQHALGYLRVQTTYIEPGVIAQQYPDVQYPLLIPVDTSAPDWIKSVTFLSSDMVGRAEFVNHMAKDIPLADITREQFEQGIELAGIGYRYTLEEIGQSMLLGVPLTSDKAAAAKRAYEEFVDDKALRGYEAKGWYGLINNPNVTVVPASSWEGADADDILSSINDVLTGVYIDSMTVEMADTLLLPIGAMSDIATARLPNTTTTILDFLMTKNVYTLQTGQQLLIRGVRGLETAGEGGVGRMVAYRRDPQVLKLHIPMPHRFLPVWQTGPLTYDIPGIFRLGPVEIRRPGAVRYVDGISEPAASA